MRTAPDRCPGALRVHEAVDGGLVRVRVPGGYLTARQLRALAQASASFGDGSLDLTSRGNVQLRGLRTSEGLGDMLADAGLLPSETHDTARNVVASPLRGLRDMVAEIDAGIQSLDPLPGRFLIGVGEADVLSVRPDLSLVGDRLLVDSRDAGPGTVATLLEAASHFLAIRTTEWRIRELTWDRPLGDLVEAGSPVALGTHGDRVVALPPLGRLTAEVLGRLAAHDVQLTPWRTVVVPRSADTTGLVTDPSSPWVGVSACAGLACAKALADIRSDAAADLGPGPRPLHWSGCDRHCGAPTGAVIRTATAKGYVLSDV
ncbi:MAG: nitrite/sulfite reductase hemoprotein beta-component ferrodoxin domain protein [Frankiales bacterium]|nr:nitrite/sulfite reductase hemoprotein beta-component ferrodoxin domain protein [Frankiales bacterium]